MLNICQTVIKTYLLTGLPGQPLLCSGNKAEKEFQLCELFEKTKVWQEYIWSIYLQSYAAYLYGVSATSWRKHKNVNFHTEGRSEEKPLLPQMMCFVWLRVSQGTRDAADDSLSRLPTRPEIDDNDYVQSFVACCLFSFSFSFFLLPQN